MNEFSILCRVLGSLYYRQPQDPLLVPLFTLIREGKLAASWPAQGRTTLLARLQKSCEMQSRRRTIMRCSSVKPAASRHAASARGWRVPRKRKFKGFSEQDSGIPTGRSGGDHLSSSCCWRLLAWRIMPQKTRGETLELLFADYYPCRGCGTMLGKSKPCAHAVLAHHGAVDPRRHRRDVGHELQERR